MKRLMCWLGWHRWEFLGRRQLAGRVYTRYDRCPVCRNVRVRGEERL